MQTCYLVLGRKQVQIVFPHLQKPAPVSKTVHGCKRDVLGSWDSMPNKDGYTKSHYWKEKGECCSSIPRTSLWHLGELRTIWQDIQQYPIAANWKVTRPVPRVSIHGVPKRHGHLTCFANCELSILQKKKIPQNQSTTPQQKFKGWFGR